MINVQRKLLLSAVELSARVSSPRHPLVTFHRQNGRMIARSTDGEAGVESVIDADGNFADFHLPATQAAAILKAMRSDEIELIPSDAVGIKGPSESFSIRSQSGVSTCWPELDGVVTHLPAEMLRSAITRCLPACAGDAGRFALNGLYFVAENGTLSLVACDGRRAHVEELCAFNVDWSGPISRKSALLFTKILSGDSCILQLGSNKLSLRCGDTLAWSLVMTGQRPTLPAPDNSGVTFELQAEDALHLARQASLVDSLTTWRVDAGVLHASASGENGSVDLRVPVATDGAQALTLQARLLVDAFGVHDPLDVLTVRLSDSSMTVSSRQWSARIQGCSDEQR